MRAACNGRERHGAVVETEGRGVFGIEKPDCGRAVCMERVEGCRLVLSERLGLQWNMQLERLQTERKPERMKGREGSSR